jgi:hypothetical protein
MENQRRWKATWFDSWGQAHELDFIGAESRIIARVDFQLTLMDMKQPIPNQFELEEETQILSRLPRFTTHVGRPVQ